MIKSEESVKKRSFFALWPDEQLRVVLAKQVQHVQANVGESVRRMRTENLHITLVFLGDITAEQRVHARTVADGVKQDGFELQVDTYGYFHRPKVLFAEPECVPEAAIALQQQMYTGLKDAGFVLDTRPWHPHMTLFRKVPMQQAERLLGDAECPSCKWPVKSFSLLQSVQTRAGVSYQEAGRWALRG